jgi:molybdopterin/thiamine biosynthesis adenylyltransferase
MTRQTDELTRRAGTHLQPPYRSPALSAPLWSLRIGQGIWSSMASHVNRGDHDEHGGALICGIAERRDGPVLLAREFVPAVDGVDYVPGTTGHRALTPAFITRLAKRARRDKWAVLLVHGHGRYGRNVGFSAIDFESHESGYRAVLDIVGGLPVGALVITDHAVAGDIWQPDGGRAALAKTTVIGTNVTTLYPAPPPRRPDSVGDDRQARLFGVTGRELLAATRVGVVGAGGAGSLIVELLARLGVGGIVVIDPDRVESHNLPRLIGSRRLDALAFLTQWPWHRLPAPLRRRMAGHTRFKTALAARAARRANPGVLVEQYRLDVSEPAAADALTSCDWIMLAADTATARLVVNKIAHQYLIPATQVGVKVDVDDDGTVGIVHAVSRMVTPEAGCLDCQGLIDHTALATEALPEALRRAADYGTGEPAPAVAALNTLAVGPAVSDMMLALTGLSEQTDVVHHRLLARRGKWGRIAPSRSAMCNTCSTTSASALARGDGQSIGGVRLR